MNSLSEHSFLGIYNRGVGRPRASSSDGRWERKIAESVGWGDRGEYEVYDISLEDTTEIEF